MASIAPPSGSAPISRPRALISAAASASERTPATCAAAISPTEWPMTTSGVIPIDSSSRYRATSSANSAGCVFSVRSRPSPENIRSLSPSGRCWSDLVERAREDGVGLVELDAHAGALGALAREQERRAPRDRRALGEVGALEHGAMLELRPRRRQRDRDVGERHLGVRRSHARRRSAWACRASSVLAESSSGSGGAPTAGAASMAGGSSRIRCALVPLMPKEDTPARRGRAFALPRPRFGEQLDRARVPVDVRRGLVGVQGRRQLARAAVAITILITPATPAAACEWPMLDLIEPSLSGSSRSWP